MMFDSIIQYTFRVALCCYIQIAQHCVARYGFKKGLHLATLNNFSKKLSGIMFNIMLMGGNEQVTYSHAVCLSTKGTHLSGKLWH